MNAQQLFQPGAAPDPAYCNLRDLEHNEELKAFCESLWQRYSPYADRHFLAEIRTQFNQRFWEMYLGVAILNHGYKLHRVGDHGPEFGIDINGRRYWLEAITPTSGEGPDAVPPLEYGARAARRVPQEQIILRITSALATKRAKWARDLANAL